MKKRIGLVIITHNNESDMPDLIRSIKQQKTKLELITFIDSGSTDLTKDFITKFSHCKNVCFLPKNNIGFAAAANIGMAHVFMQNNDLCLVLNPDTILGKNSISALLKGYSKLYKRYKSSLGLIQPLIVHKKSPHLVNSAGNELHYLGFGYCGGYNEKAENFTVNKEIRSVSGAAMLVPRHYYKLVGNFDEKFFMYSEDQDYSFRGLAFGYHHFLVPDAIVKHKYSFSKNKMKFYLIERNRLLSILKMYEKTTLLKLALIFLLTELSILFYSIAGGWFVLKLRSYIDVIKNIKYILQKRKQYGVKKLVNDRHLVQELSDTLSFRELDHFMLRFFLNPLFKYYRKFFFSS